MRRKRKKREKGNTGEKPSAAKKRKAQPSRIHLQCQVCGSLTLGEGDHVTQKHRVLTALSSHQPSKVSTMFHRDSGEIGCHGNHETQEDSRHFLDAMTCPDSLLQLSGDKDAIQGQHHNIAQLKPLSLQPQIHQM